MEEIEAIDFQYLSDRARAYIMGLEAKLKEKNLRIQELQDRLDRPLNESQMLKFRNEVARETTAKLSNAISEAARTLGTLHYEANKVYRDATEGRYYEWDSRIPTIHTNPRGSVCSSGTSTNQGV